MQKLALIKCCERPVHPGHIAVVRLNRARAHSTRNSTDSAAKGYNRKKHIKRKEDAVEYGNFKVNITE
jgi:hypothetical protein